MISKVPGTSQLLESLGQSSRLDSNFQEGTAPPLSHILHDGHRYLRVAHKWLTESVTLGVGRSRVRGDFFNVSLAFEGVIDEFLIRS